MTQKFRKIAIVAISVALGASLVAVAQQGAAPQPAAQPAAAEPQVDPAKVVISVGDSKMTAGEFNEFISNLPPEVQAMAKGPAKRKIAEDLVKLKLLAAEAKKQGLDQSPKFKQQMELMRDNALAGALFAQLQNTLVSEDELKKYYDENKASFEKVTARHILVATGGEKGLTDEQAKAKADEIKKKIDGGADFAALAKAESADPGSKDDGGVLPPFPRGQMVQEFEDAAFNLKENEVSAPVKTKFGYHIIQLQKKDVSPLDEVKEEISETLKPKKLEGYVENLKKASNPTLDETFFGPAPKAAAEPAPGAPAAASAR